MPPAPDGLADNPFQVLGATPHDDLARIVALAEDKALLGDDDACRAARSALSSPRFRLAAEIGWFPGVDPGQVPDLLARVDGRPLAALDGDGIPPLARANLMAAALSRAGGGAADQTARRILAFAHLVDAVDADAVLQQVNADRARSGFAPVRDVAAVEAELAELRRRHRGVVRDLLDRLPAADLVDTLAAAVRDDTARGTRRASRFLDELVDLYESEAAGFLDAEIAKVAALVQWMREAVPRDPAACAARIDVLDRALRGWVRVAEPIQLSARARGLEHGRSRSLAWHVRGLAIELFNAHDQLEQAQRITALLASAFAAVPEVVARMEADAQALAAIESDRRDAGRKDAQYAEQITYRARIGRVFKRDLAISPDGVEWQGRRMALPAITRVRWGGRRHYVNGVPIGTWLTVAVGDDASEIVMTMRDNVAYQAFLDRLWTAVCRRLMVDILHALRDGRTLHFGTAAVSDAGVTVTRVRWFRAVGQELVAWSRLRIWSANGQFFIGAQDDKKLTASMSYIETPNAHLLEHLIRLKFKNGDRTLSALLSPAPPRDTAS